VERDWGSGTNVTLMSANLLDEQGHPTERFAPGTPLRLRVVMQITGMTGMSLDVVLRNEHNLAVSYYSSNNFSQVPLPTRAGRYQCTVALDAYYLAAGEYCDLHQYRRRSPRRQRGALHRRYL
jgi:lipopolysaccharide transport system ATP-binding protein